MKVEAIKTFAYKSKIVKKGDVLDLDKIDIPFTKSVMREYTDVKHKTKKKPKKVLDKG